MRKRKVNKNATLSGSLLGLAVSIMISILGVAGLTQMSIKQMIGEGSLHALICVIQLVAALSGSQFEYSAQKDTTRRMPIISVTAYAVLLLIMGLFMDGKFQRVILKLIAIGVGTTISCIICLKKQRSQMMKKRYSR